MTSADIVVLSANRIDCGSSCPFTAKRSTAMSCQRQKRRQLAIDIWGLGRKMRRVRHQEGVCGAGFRSCTFRFQQIRSNRTAILISTHLPGSKRVCTFLSTRTFTTASPDVQERKVCPTAPSRIWVKPEGRPTVTMATTAPRTRTGW